VNVPTDAGAADCAIWGGRWPWPGGAPRGGPPDIVALGGATTTEGEVGPSGQTGARLSCLSCDCFFFESRVNLGTGWAKIASSLSDGSESPMGLRGPSAWPEGSFALDAACSASSARRIQPSLPFWKSCLTVALLSPARRFLTEVFGLPFPRVVDDFVRPLGRATERNLSMISRVRECCLTWRSEDVTRKRGISASSDGVDSDTMSTS